MKRIGGHTKPFAVLGHPIGHSLSPVMHNAAFEALGMDAIYLAFDVHPDRLMAVLPVMADMGFGGVNLTVPLKETAFRGLRERDESVRRLGAVNTVEFLSGRLKGHNTDGRGFLAAVGEAFGQSVAGKRVFVLGSGGGGRAVAVTCAVEGAALIVLADLDEQRPIRVAGEIAGFARETRVEALPARPEAWMRAARNADLVVQATPSGMKRDDPALLGPAAFRPGQMVLDLVYMYPETAFMKAAQQADAQAANGLGMLLHQGALAFEIWTRTKPPLDVMRKALETAVYGEG